MYVCYVCVYDMCVSVCNIYNYIHDQPSGARECVCVCVKVMLSVDLACTDTIEKTNKHTCSV